MCVIRKNVVGLPGQHHGIHVPELPSLMGIIREVLRTPFGLHALVDPPFSVMPIANVLTTSSSGTGLLVASRLPNGPMHNAGDVARMATHSHSVWS